MNSLFEPTTLDGLALQNRIVMAPLTRNRADAMGAPLAALRENLLYTADAEGYSDYPPLVS